MTAPDINDLLVKLTDSPNLSDTEKAYLREQLTARKKYGLIWEDKPEAVEQQLLTGLPVLTEVPERRVLSEPGFAGLNGVSGLAKRTTAPVSETIQIPLAFGSAKSDSLVDYHQSTNESDLAESISTFAQSKENPPPDSASFAGTPDRPGLNPAPNHTLIEGDNLHALTVLNYTHAGRVDVIYIDPPYNTGNKDFKYNDTFVDREDSYRHSKWLSFMAKRLRLAKTLLNHTGVIFISIDDNEQAQLKLLCDEVFGEENFVGVVVWKNATDNNPTNIASEHEYIYCYSKNRTELKPVWKSLFSHFKEVLIEKERELIQNIYSQELLQKNYTQWFKDNKQFLGELDRYKYIDRDGVYTGSQSVHNPGKEGYRYDVLHPQTGKPCKEPLMGYRFPESTMKRLLESGKILFGENESKIIELKVYAKDYQSKFSSLIELDGRIGANELRTLFWDSEKVFTNPKPSTLIEEILGFTAPKNALILDFFAGSGTTLHAVMALNAEDGGNRQCILVTNNENNIAEEVCYERNRRVIQGYTNSKGVAVPGLSGNALRYYKTTLVGREKTLANKRALMRQATDLLCLKEGCYEDVTPPQPLPVREGLNHPSSFSPSLTGRGWGGVIRLFTNPDGRAMLLIYDEDAIDEAITLIQSRPCLPGDPLIKVYVFAPSAYPYTDDFADVITLIELCALPEAIYQTYQRLLPPATDARS